MYGKAFASMYTGSMVGSGMNVYAVWNYIIAMMREGVVEVNPRLVAFTLGGKESEVQSALEFLCGPDPKSRSKEAEGRRLIKEGEYQYRVVNWKFYEQIKSESDRREYNRIKQREYRIRKAKKYGPQAAERQYEKNGESEVPHGTIQPKDENEPF